MTCLHYRSSQSKHRGMTTWLNYITETSQNKHRGTRHKIHRWIHSEVTNTLTRVTLYDFTWLVYIIDLLDRNIGEWHDSITLQTHPKINIGVQYIRYIGEYIPKLQTHQHWYHVEIEPKWYNNCTHKIANQTCKITNKGDWNWSITLICIE